MREMIKKFPRSPSKQFPKFVRQWLLATPNGTVNSANLLAYSVSDQPNSANIPLQASWSADGECQAPAESGLATGQQKGQKIGHCQGQIGGESGGGGAAKPTKTDLFINI